MEAFVPWKEQTASLGSRPSVAGKTSASRGKATSNTAQISTNPMVVRPTALSRGRGGGTSIPTSSRARGLSAMQSTLSVYNTKELGLRLNDKSKGKFVKTTCMLEGRMLKVI